MSAAIESPIRLYTASIPSPVFRFGFTRLRITVAVGVRRDKSPRRHFSWITGGGMTTLVRKLLVLGATAVGMLAWVCATAWAQDGGTITGRGLDATTTAPVPSAQVQIVGTARGSTTGEDGLFRIPIVRPGVYQVRVLRIGYQASTQSVTVGNGQTIDLSYSLTPAAITLDQVVTLATGETTRKREQGNVVGTLTPEPSTLATAGNMGQLLTGRIPGVDVASPGGTIGSSARFRIPGAGSLSFSNDPLLIIYGVCV